MAQFDIKNAMMYIRDGYTASGRINKPSKTGKVNLMAGYNIGDSTMVVDSFTGAVAVGDTFTIAGDATIYTVSAHSETLGNTTSISFTPNLVATAADDAVITVAASHKIGLTAIVVDTFTVALVTGDRFNIAGDATIYTITAHTETLGSTTGITFTPALVAAAANDAVVTVLPHQLQIKLGEGNLTYTEKKARQYIKDRGRLSTVRNADEEPVEVKMDAQWEFIRASTGLPPSIEDVLKQRGEASTWVTSAADPCEPYAVDIVIEYTPPCGNIETEIITLSDFRYEDLPHDTKAGTISISGKCNITEASVSRV